MKKKIRWEKFVDPLNNNMDETEFPGYNTHGTAKQDVATKQYDGDDDDDDDFDDGKEPIYSINPMKIVNTPFGLLTMTDGASACKHFDFWILHTNFDITPIVARAIELVSGVETLDVLTRYRVRIGFTRSNLFNTKEVKKNVEQAVLELDRPKKDAIDENIAMEFTPDISKNVATVRDKILSEVNYWAIYILPNGELDILSSEKLDHPFIQRLSVMARSHELIGGYIMTHEDY